MTDLREKILNECKNLKKLVGKIRETILLIDNREDDIYFDSLISALTLYLENFYMGVERVFRLIANKLDQIIPTGESWHIQLLKQMSLELHPIRSAVISQETYEKLNELRGFRHVARSLYAYDLEPRRVIQLSKNVEKCYEIFMLDISTFRLENNES